LSVNSNIAEGKKAGLLNSGNGASYKWKFKEVCEINQGAFAKGKDSHKPHTIPGTIEAEDYDTGCPGDAYYDSDEINQGGRYRPNEGVDIDTCSEGGFTLGWTSAGEWLAYTVNVSKSTNYKVTFNVASIADNTKLHLECDGINKTGTISLPNTGGFQAWQLIKKNIKLESGQHILKIVIDGGPLNLDKMIFEEVK
jgi:hypothetical protein